MPGGYSRTDNAASPVRTEGILEQLSQESLGDLFEPVVRLGPRLVEEALDVRAEPWVAPAVSRGFLGVEDFAHPRALEKCLGRSRFKRRIVARWQRVGPLRPVLFGIFANECA